MPYLPNDRRPLLVPGADAPPANKAELCFQVACLLDAYLRHHGVSYATCSDAIAAAADASAELRRVVMAPYEAAKLEENGSVWSCV